MLALAMIVKGTKQEAKALDKCLASVGDNVDGIFITITQPSKDVEAVCNKYGASISHFKWVNDFAKARNFNFKQVPKKYSHIFWLDADDILNTKENLKELVKSGEDVFTMNYLYHIDENGDADVVHIKTRIVKNNGCAEWRGKIHEDLAPTRDINILLLQDSQVVHKNDDTRIEDSKVRNLAIAKEMAKELPDDPRSYWNLGNAHKAGGNDKEALEAFVKFLDTTEADDEKYIAHNRMADIYIGIGKPEKALEHAQFALGMYPYTPDAYNTKGYALFAMNQFEKAALSFHQSLSKKPSMYTVNAYNPRDYDFYPLLALAKCYINLSMPLLAEPCLDACVQIMPNRKDLKKILKVIKAEGKVQEKVLKKAKQLEKVKDKDELRKEIDSLPNEMRSHPAICKIRNVNLIKEKSSGKDVVLYCYHTDKVWTPTTALSEGVGGSEEAVMNLAEQWATKGFNVTVYNNCGHEEQLINGVTYKPTWSWNYRDKQDVVILWRTAKAVDYEINADKVIIDVHDTVPASEFTEERLKKIHKVMVKTKAHRDLYPDVPDDKIEVVPNGMDFGLFNQKVKKDQYLMVNTSSPDRSMDVLPKLFKEVKKQVPKARLKWAYGFDIFDIAHKADLKKMKWKENTLKAMEDAGIENLGRLTQKEATRLYLEGNILAYPTEFFEIDCITVKKAQACGAIPVTTDFAALNESVKTGVKVHSTKTSENWAKPYQFHFGLEDVKAQQEWVDACVKILNTPMEDRTEMKEKMEAYRWEKIATKWINVWKD